MGKTIDTFEIYDNSVLGMAPKLIASVLGREVTFLATELPAWLDEALGHTPHSTAKLRECFERGKALPIGD